MYKIHITKEAKEDISALDRSGDKKSIEKLKKIFFELQNTQLRELDSQSYSNMAIQDTGLAESTKKTG